jgi:hypothetical protein
MKLTTYLRLVPRSRMCGAIPPLPQYNFMVWCLIKHRDNFTFYIFPQTELLTQCVSKILHNASKIARDLFVINFHF